MDLKSLAFKTISGDMHIQYQDREFDIQRKDENTLIINGQEIDLSGSSSSKIILNGKAEANKVV